MHDYILLVPGTRLGLGDEYADDGPASYKLHCIRLATTATAEEVLAGTPFKSLQRNDIVVFEEILSPDGRPPGAHSMGSPACESIGDALGIISAAFKNSESVLCQHNFSASTPIYLMHDGKQPEQINSTSN